MTPAETITWWMARLRTVGSAARSPSGRIAINVPNSFRGDNVGGYKGIDSIAAFGAGGLSSSTGEQLVHRSLDYAQPRTEGPLRA